MRSISIMLVYLLAIPVILAAQPDTCQACKKCNKKALCRNSIPGAYNPGQVKVIGDNWTDFEGTLLENDLPAKGGKNVMALRFDGHGCLYPPFIINDQLKDEFMDHGGRRTYLRSLTFYNLMRQYPDSLRKYWTAPMTLFDQLKNTIDPYTSFASQFAFRDIWNAYFLKQMADSINGIIKRKGISQFVCFIPGYNVPYSLAHLHGNSVFSDYVDALPPDADPEKLLFVRIFWPSNDKKNHNFTWDNCNMDNQLVLVNKQLYNYVTNSGYLGGAAMRNLMNLLPEDINMAIVSHSFGAAFSSAIVLPPDSKMGNTSKGANPLILAAFKDKIPQQRCYLFYSAPGIPGVLNFKGIDPVANKDHFFYIGYNRKDKVLRKKVVPVLTVFSSAGRSNATTLGCNWRGEVFKLKTSMDNIKMESHFAYCPNGENKNHDFFCYRQQKEFNNNFRKFVEESYSRALSIKADVSPKMPSTPH